MQPVSCADCQALQRRLRDLQTENERLRRQLDEATRVGKCQAAPFAKGKPAVEPKKPVNATVNNREGAEGRPMPGVTRLDNEAAPAWDVAQLRLLGLRDGESLSFDVDEDTWLIGLHISGFGYLVTGCGVGERDYFTLVERTLGDEPVTAFDGGDTRVFVRYAFVSAPIMLKAVETYYLTAERDRESEWVSDGDAMYE
jgi:hypothetical protein